MPSRLDDRKVNTSVPNNHGYIGVLKNSSCSCRTPGVMELGLHFMGHVYCRVHLVHQSLPARAPVYPKFKDRLVRYWLLLTVYFMKMGAGLVCGHRHGQSCSNRLSVYSVVQPRCNSSPGNEASFQSHFTSTYRHHLNIKRRSTQPPKMLLVAWCQASPGTSRM